MSVSKELGSLIAPCPLPDLTGSIVKLNDLYSEGGSYGDVYRCKHYGSSGTKEVAVKSFRFNFKVKQDDGNGNGSDTVVKMARRELGIWRRLDHKNIVPFLGIVHGFGRIGAASLVSLWMPNGTLHDFLSRYDDTLTTARRLELLLDIADGLLYLHSFPIIHGDLSCKNVLLDANDNARLTDFGYASLIGEIPEALAYLQMSTRQPGTLRWAAPEQIKEDTCQPTTKSDIYSFGNLALQVFSGKLPWSEVRGNAAIVLLLAQGQKPRRPQSRPVDDRHWEFIERCWSEVQERPSASDIVPALQHFLASLPLSPRLGDFLRLSTQLPDSRPTSSGSPLSLTDMDVDDDDKTNDVDDTSIAHSVLTAHPGCSDSPMQVYLAPSQDDVFSSPQLPAASPLSPLPPDVKMLSPPMRLEDTFPQQDVGSEPHYNVDYFRSGTGFQSHAYPPVVLNVHHGSDEARPTHHAAPLGRQWNGRVAEESRVQRRRLKKRQHERTRDEREMQNISQIPTAITGMDTAHRSRRLGGIPSRTRVSGWERRDTEG